MYLRSLLSLSLLAVTIYASACDSESSGSSPPTPCGELLCPCDPALGCSNGLECLPFAGEFACNMPVEDIAEPGDVADVAAVDTVDISVEDDLPAELDGIVDVDADPVVIGAVERFIASCAELCLRGQSCVSFDFEGCNTFCTEFVGIAEEADEGRADACAEALGTLGDCQESRITCDEISGFLNDLAGCEEQLGVLDGACFGSDE